MSPAIIPSRGRPHHGGLGAKFPHPPVSSVGARCPFTVDRAGHFHGSRPLGTLKNPDRADSIADIAAKGANTVRVVLSDGDRWTRTRASEVTSLIGRCKAAKVICVLEVHDTTGYGADGAATTLDRAADYWVGVKSAHQGPGGLRRRQHRQRTVRQQRLRPVDRRHQWRDGQAPRRRPPPRPDGRRANWGQDWSGTMRDNAASVFASEPDRNTIFSLHMYGVYDTAAEVRDGFDPGSLTAWGNRVFHGADDISSTSRTATVYAAEAAEAAVTAAAAGPRNGYPYCVGGWSSGPDGDGWSWANSRSCVVRGSSADRWPRTTTVPQASPYALGT